MSAREGGAGILDEELKDELEEATRGTVSGTVAIEDELEEEFGAATATAAVDDEFEEELGPAVCTAAVEDELGRELGAAAGTAADGEDSGEVEACAARSCDEATEELEFSRMFAYGAPPSMYTSVPCGAPGCSNDGDALSPSGSEYVGETGENGGVVGEGDLIIGP